MKGVLFRALMSYAEEQFGPLALERVLDRAALERHGAYTTVGQYPAEELLVLVRAMQAETGEASSKILVECGRRTIAYVIAAQAGQRPEGSDLQAVLSSLEALIRANYLKLYPGTVVPSLTMEGSEEGWVHLLYGSPRPLADLAEGLILGTLDVLKIDTQVRREDLAPYDGRAARFRVKLPEAGSGT